MKRFLAGASLCALLLGCNVQSVFAYGWIYNESTDTTDIVATTAKTGAREGTSEAFNVLGLVEIGDAGIQAALKHGRISQIHHVDKEVRGCFIFYRKVTHVYGE